MRKLAPIFVLLMLMTAMWAKDKTVSVKGQCGDLVKQMSLIAVEENLSPSYDADLGVMGVYPQAPGVGKQIATMGYGGLFSTKSGRIIVKQNGENCDLKLHGAHVEKLVKKVQEK